MLHNTRLLLHPTHCKLNIVASPVLGDGNLKPKLTVNRITAREHMFVLAQRYHDQACVRKDMGLALIS